MSLLSLQENEIFTYSTTSPEVHRPRRGYTYTSWIKQCIGTWDRVGQHQPDPMKAVTTMVAGLISSKYISRESVSQNAVACHSNMLTSRCHPPPWHLEFIIDRHHNEDAAVVRSTDLLDIITDFLGIQPAALEAALSYRTKLLKRSYIPSSSTQMGPFAIVTGMD